MAQEETQAEVDRLFRHTYGLLVSSLTRLLGVQHIEIIEDIVQESLLKALQVWPYHAPIQDPVAWLLTVAKNKALDWIRGQERATRFATEFDPLLHSGWTRHNTFDNEIRLDGLQDDALRMMMACCHPSIALNDQLAAALKWLCGFTAAEIGEALLCQTSTIQKRIQRVRNHLETNNIRLEIPEGKELKSRLRTVLRVLYLMFNKGYYCAKSPQPIQRDVCLEAMRLTENLRRHALLGTPETSALLALFCLLLARFPARQNGEGQLVLMEDQDRTLWDPILIERGRNLLQCSAKGPNLSRYHVEAGIALLHAEAPSHAATDWLQITQLYAVLSELAPSETVQLNYAIAQTMAGQPEAALTRLNNLQLTIGQHWLLAAKAFVCERLNQPDQAQAFWRMAEHAADSDQQTHFYRQKQTE
ncbi:MAG: RNA polymerase subunit sigma-24 [Acidobacteria bacterium]|nr:RNA polymerase subunit sigma-24 [Acidobacteriota bacterium]